MFFTKKKDAFSPSISSNKIVQRFRLRFTCCWLNSLENFRWATVGMMLFVLKIHLWLWSYADMMKSNSTNIMVLVCSDKNTFCKARFEPIILHSAQTFCNPTQRTNTPPKWKKMMRNKKTIFSQLPDVSLFVTGIIDAFIERCQAISFLFTLPLQRKNPVTPSLRQDHVNSR